MSPIAAFLLTFLFSTALADFVLIRNPSSGLVLDASDGQVRIQKFTGSIYQNWKLEPTNRGSFYIVSIRTGNVLDVIDRTNLREKGIIVAPKMANICQSWYINRDRTISNACANYVLDISQYQYIPGNQIITYPNNGGSNQKFVLQLA